MDNFQQIEEIKRYRIRLAMVLGRKIDLNTAARMWIRRYAGEWRKCHPEDISCTRKHRFFS